MKILRIRGVSMHSCDMAVNYTIKNLFSDGDSDSLPNKSMKFSRVFYDIYERCYMTPVRLLTLADSSRFAFLAFIFTGFCDRYSTIVIG